MRNFHCQNFSLAVAQKKLFLMNFKFSLSLTAWIIHQAKENLIQVMSSKTPSRLNLIGTMKRILLVTSKCERNFFTFSHTKKKIFRSKKNCEGVFSLRTEEKRRENRKEHISLGKRSDSYETGL